MFYQIKKCQESLLCAARSGESVMFGGYVNNIRAATKLNTTLK